MASSGHVLAHLAIVNASLCHGWVSECGFTSSNIPAIHGRGNQRLTSAPSLPLCHQGSSSIIRLSILPSVSTEIKIIHNFNILFLHVLHVSGYNLEDFLFWKRLRLRSIFGSNQQPYVFKCLDGHRILLMMKHSLLKIYWFSSFVNQILSVIRRMCILCSTLI